MPCLSPTHGTGAAALESRHDAERKEKSTPFGVHNESLLRRQPGARHDASFVTVSQACMTVKVVVACTVVHQPAWTEFDITVR